MSRRERRLGGVIGWLFCPTQIRRCHDVSVTHFPIVVEETYKNITDWFSPLFFSLAKALLAKSSASPMPLPTFPPSCPLDEDVKVFRQMSPCDDRRAVGKETWKRLARCAVK